MKSLEGKVAIVTGSGQGVGEGIAMALSSYGVKVALLGRTFKKVETVASNIAKSGGIALPIECDVKNLASIEKAIALVTNEYKGIQILINNAQEVPLGTLSLIHI